MKATLVSYGSMGDILPMVALAVGLRAAGHQVVTVGDEAGAELAARYGLEFHTLAGRLQELVEPGRPLALLIDAGHFTLKSLSYDAHDRDRLSLIQEVAQGSDVVLGMPVAHYHALAAAREVGARPVLGVLQPLAPTSAMTPAGAGMPSMPRVLRRPIGEIVQWGGWMNARRSLNSARRELGQAPIADPTRDAFSLCAWSPTLVPQPDDWPTHQFAVTGHWHLPAKTWVPDPDLAAFLAAGEPPVYVGFGTMQGFSAMPRLLDGILTGLASRRVILAAGPNVLRDRQLSRNVHRMTGFVPHDWLFSRCSVIVHHCGAGTGHEAAAAGVPSVPVPISMDQPFWARRLHDLGIASAPINPRRPSIEAIHQAITKAESDPLRLRAVQVAQRIAQENGVSAAITRLEQLL